MPTDSFGVVDSASDGDVVRGQSGTEWPPTGTYTVGDTSSTARVGKYVGATKLLRVGLLRFDTSSIPNNAIITSANLKLYFNAPTGTGRNLVGEWYDWTPPLASTHWTSTSSSSAFSRAFSSITAEAVNTMTLTTPTTVNVSGFTGIRLHVDGADPGSSNYYVNFNTVTATSSVTRPVLEVTYTAAANQPPTADFTYFTNALDATFTNTSGDPDGTIASYAWTFGDGGESALANPEHTYASAGTYSVTLTVTDNNEASDSETKSVVVSDAPPEPETPPGIARSYLSRHVFLREDTLSGAMDVSQTTVPRTDLSYWPQSGVGMIEDEKVSWTGKTAPNGPGNLTGVTRALFGTTAASHASGVSMGLLGRHDGGLATKRMAVVFPDNGGVTLQELSRHEDKQAFAWVEFDNFREQAQLDITSAPHSSGNLRTTLDEGGSAVTEFTAVTAAREVRSLTINGTQTAAGTATLTLDGETKSVVLPGSVTEVHQIVLVRGSKETSGQDRIIHYDSTGTLHVTMVEINPGESTSTIAARVRGRSYAGWTLSGSGSTIIATATTVGQRGGFGAGSFSGFNYDEQTLVKSEHTLLQEGSGSLNTSQAADQLRNLSFPGWQAGGTGSTVTWTSVEPGARNGTYSYDAGGTGATSTSGITQTTAGSSTTIDNVAAAIRTTYAANTYWDAGGTGGTVTFKALTDGPKRDATFSAGGTGAKGTMQTVKQGSSDIVAHIRDSLGVSKQRRLMSSLEVDTVFNIESAVSGAGTKKAVVSFWGSFDSDPFGLLWEVRNVDLSQHVLGWMAYGVTAESSDDLTWDIRTDEVEPTNRGKSFYRHHNAIGGWLNQGHGFFLLDPQQTRQDQYIQGLRVPIIPGEQVTIGAYLAWEGVPVLAKPLYVSLHHADGTATDLGALTSTGLSAGGQVEDGDWQHVYGTFTVPVAENPAKQAYEFRVNSRDITAGTFLMQELAISIGTEVKRTYLYAPEGICTVTYDTGTPRPAPYARFGRKRIALENQFDTPSGTSASTEYQSAADLDSFGSTWYTDPTVVDDLDAYRVRGILDSDGLVPVKMLPGFPRVANRLLIGRSSDQPILLQPDGTEFLGGVWFVKYGDWHYDEDPTVSKLMSGRSVKQGMHPPVGFIPKLALGAVRPETVQRLQHTWHKELYVAEVYDKSFTISLLAKPVFDRKVPAHRDSRGWQRGSWETGDISAEIVEIRDIAL